MAPIFIVTLTREGDHLSVQANCQPKFEVFRESDYVLKVVDAQITFEPTTGEPATQLILQQNRRDQHAKRIE